ncbi:uncharacterized protein LOC141632011 [Silene latifolia]|uniref:uncharacterized protein LOC141632011 n=1 Tax=Silene latifolia TaxID=37657 RepID=UPI003D78759C
MKVASWNVRGFNNPIKQKEVSDFIWSNKVDIMAILETRVKKSKASKILKKTFSQWIGVCNYDKHYNSRIWVLFNPKTVSFTDIVMEEQIITCKVHHFETNKVFFLGLVFGSNDATKREILWKNLADTATVAPWLVLGDFKIVRCPEEKLSLTPPVLQDMMAFNSCLATCQLDDINSTGCDLTWTNKQEVSTRVWSKLDRVLVNPSWSTVFPTSYATFPAAGISDHSPSMVHIFTDQKIAKRFSFLNSWIEHPDYLKTVKDAWFSNKPGSPIFSFFEKLKFVKHALTQLHHKAYSNISSRAAEAKRELLQCQLDLHHPFSSSLIQQEHHLLQHYSTLKVYYQDLLGRSSDVQQLDADFFSQRACVADTDKQGLLNPITCEEIKSVVFSMDSQSSPGLDGFSAGFSKSAWSIIKKDFCKFVLNFFRTSNMSKKANSTIISLIPKKATPSYVLDSRPISYCTVFYKTVSKILSNRLKHVLPYLIGDEQAAFVQGRSICENILHSQSLVKGYSKKLISPRCLIKVDIRKGCITGTWFSLKINGGISGYFKGRSGIRQGDPLSPYLFMLSMEILLRSLRVLCSKPQVSYHPKCSKLNLTHLIFVDDLMIFTRSDVPSVMAVKDSLAEFAKFSSLEANIDKTNIYFGGVSKALKLFKGILAARDYLVAKTGSIHAAQHLLHSCSSKQHLQTSTLYGYLLDAPLQEDWYNVLLHPKIVPSHKIITSLAVHSRLATIENLQARGFHLMDPSTREGVSLEDHLAKGYYFSCCLCSLDGKECSNFSAK